MMDDQLILPNGKIITFNDEQVEGLRKISVWLRGTETFFTLAGYAGSGKTTIIKKILDTYFRRVAVSAPTHKAKKVISNITNREGVTLHSLLGLRPDLDLDDFNPNDPQFSPIVPPKISDFDWVIIDEASMINSDLFELVKKTVKGMGTKVLFMGDPAQIPPIGEKESVVFFDESIEIHWLTKIERQTNNNPLLTVYDTLRNNLTLLNGGFKRITNINENGDGILFIDDKATFREKVLEKFNSDEFKTNMNFVKLIAWRNVTVMMSNNTIRTSLFSENANIVEDGDILMCYRSIQAKKGYYNIIENSTDYQVSKVSRRKRNKHGIMGFNVCLTESDGSERNLFIVDSTDENNLHDYAEKHDLLKAQGLSIKKEWKPYYNFRRENLLMTVIKTYRNGKKRPQSEVINKDLDYGYAITAHKAQGSTYSHTLILLDDINLNKNVKERNQILYVALTRPIKSVTILHDKS